MNKRIFYKISQFTNKKKLFVIHTAGPAGRYGAPFEETIAALLLLILLLLLLADVVIDVTVAVALAGVRSIVDLSGPMCGIGAVVDGGIVAVIASDTGADICVNVSTFVAVVPFIAVV